MQVLIKKQAEKAADEAAELLQPGQRQRRAAAQLAAKQQRSLSAKLKLQPADAAASRPQGSPAACLSLALPIPGWRVQ